MKTKSEERIRELLEASAVNALTGDELKELRLLLNSEPVRMFAYHLKVSHKVRSTVSQEIEEVMRAKINLEVPISDLAFLSRRLQFDHPLKTKAEDLVIKLANDATIKKLEEEVKLTIEGTRLDTELIKILEEKRKAQ